MQEKVDYNTSALVERVYMMHIAGTVEHLYAMVEVLFSTRSEQGNLAKMLHVILYYYVRVFIISSEFSLFH